MTAGFLTVPFSGNSLLPDSFLSFFLFFSPFPYIFMERNSAPFLFFSYVFHPYVHNNRYNVLG